MNGTNERWLRGMLVALGAALALTSIGCLAQPGDSESDGDENVASAEQELDPAAPQNPVNGGSGVDLPDGDDVAVGGKVQDPQPQPWQPRAVDGDSDPTPGPDPYAPTMSSTPSDGHNDS